VRAEAGAHCRLQRCKQAKLQLLSSPALPTVPWKADFEACSPIPPDPFLFIPLIFMESPAFVHVRISAKLHGWLKPKEGLFLDDMASTFLTGIRP
jgi:hypothetical protein